MRALMLHALDFGMLNGDYAFLTVNLLPSAAIGNNTFMGNDGRDAEAALAFRGILSIHVREPTTTLWQSFKEEVREKMNDVPFHIKLDESEQVIVYYYGVGGARGATYSSVQHNYQLIVSITKVQISLCAPMCTQNVLGICLLTLQAVSNNTHVSA